MRRRAAPTSANTARSGVAPLCLASVGLTAMVLIGVASGTAVPARTAAHLRLRDAATLWAAAPMVVSVAGTAVVAVLAVSAAGRAGRSSATAAPAASRSTQSRLIRLSRIGGRYGP